MSRALAAVACVLTLPGPVLAADYTDPLPRYERFGDDFKCHLSRADSAQMSSRGWPKDQACMHIGPLYIGMARAEMEKLLGTPNQDLMVNGQKNFVYLAHRNAAKEVTAYVVTTYAADDTVHSLQLTATLQPVLARQDWSNAWLFSGIALGDSENTLRMRMGEPYKTEASDQAGTLVWDYRYFSFEIHDRRISSIRTAKDPENSKSQKA